MSVILGTTYKAWVDYRGQHELERLLQQHKCQQYAVGPLIIPPLPSSPVILDVGAGPCDWLTDVLKAYPTATVYGSDITDQMFPPVEIRPPNLHLVIHDIFEQPPPEFLGKFDLINTRNVFYWFPQSKWDQALRNMKRMLKPGGWIQNVEYGPFKFERGAALRLHRLFRGIYSTLSLHNLGALSSYLEPAGFISVSALEKPAYLGNNHPISYLKKYSVSTVRPMFDLVKLKGIPGTKVVIEGVTETYPDIQECDRLIEEAVEQTKNGSASVSVHINTAQAPLMNKY